MNSENPTYYHAQPIKKDGTISLPHAKQTDIQLFYLPGENRDSTCLKTLWSILHKCTFFQGDTTPCDPTETGTLKQNNIKIKKHMVEINIG